MSRSRDIANLLNTVDAKGDILVGSADNSITKLTVGSTGQLPLVDFSTASGLRYVDPPTNRNRVINGEMLIDQRNSGASVAITSGGQYCVDRWNFNISASGVSAQQTTTVPAGFKNSLQVTSTAATTVTPSTFFELLTTIEGNNVRDLGFGTASASKITLSFWVRSSLTGTFTGRIGNTAVTITPTRNYVFSYTIGAANTWERKTVTIDGDTTGSWGTGNGAGIRIGFCLGAGSNFSTTAGAWSDSDRLTISGAINLVATNGATFALTGVQLEAGPIATPFEFEPYETTLRKCQRYYYRITGDDAYSSIGYGFAESTSVVNILVTFPVEMRNKPSSVGYSNIRLVDFQNSITVASLALAAPRQNRGRSILSVTASGSTAIQYRPYNLELNANSSGYVEFNAEL